MNFEEIHTNVFWQNNLMEILWPSGYIMLDCLDFQVGPLSLIYYCDIVMLVIARNLHYKNIFLAIVK